MSPTKWYHSQDGQQLGPVSKQELKALADAGDLSPDDLVWNNSWDDWRPASSLANLFSQSSNSPPPIAARRTQVGVEQAAKAASFMDVKFETFMTPRLIGVLYAVVLIALAGTFVVSLVVAIMGNEGIWTLMGITVGGILGIAVVGVLLRCSLEMMLLSFRAVEHLSHLEHLKRDNEE